MSGLLLVLVGCGSTERAAPTAPEPAELHMFLDGAVRKGGGAVILQAVYDPQGEMQVPEPVAQGLEFTADGPPRTESVGDRSVITQRYVFRGAKGAYEIEPAKAVWRFEDQTVEAMSTALFVDIEVPPPEVGEFADIVEPHQVVRIPWLPILTVSALFAAGLGFAFRRRPAAERVAAAVPPDIRALRAWEAARDDASLTIEDKARRLSEIFRVYVEDVLRFEATARTTAEVLQMLQALEHLPDGNVVRAKRILRATDRVKFAEDRPASEWVAELDADFRAFIESTRPAGFVTAPDRPTSGSGGAAS